MPTTITFNVDTIEFTVPCADPFLPDQDIVSKTSPDGVVRFRKQNRQIIYGKEKVHNLTVKPDDLKKQLEVSGSPFAWECTQNVFTPGSVKDACWSALIAISDRLGINPMSAKLKQKFSQIVLRRVDLAINFRFSNQEEVLALIDQLKSQWVKESCNVYNSSNGVHWLPSKGEEYSFRIYAKGPEMKKFDSPSLTPEKKRLVKQSACLLRVELQLRGRALRKHGLVNPRSWTEENTEKVFRHYYGLLPLSNVKGGPIPSEEFDRLPKALRPVLNAWASGNLAIIYPEEGALVRYRRQLKAYGWDIKQGYNGATEIIQVKDDLDLSRSLQKVPPWLKTAGLYPDEAS